MASAHARQALAARTKTTRRSQLALRPPRRGGEPRAAARSAPRATQCNNLPRARPAPHFSAWVARTTHARPRPAPHAARERGQRERETTRCARRAARAGAGAGSATQHANTSQHASSAPTAANPAAARAPSAPPPPRAHARRRKWAVRMLFHGRCARLGGRRRAFVGGKWGALLCIHAPCGAPRARRRPWGRRAAPLRHEGCMCDPCDKCERARGRRRRSKGRPQERLLVCRIEVCTRGCPRRPARW